MNFVCVAGWTASREGNTNYDDTVREKKRTRKVFRVFWKKKKKKKNRGTIPPVEIDCPFTKKSYLIKKNTYIYIKREKKKIVRPPAVSNLIFIFQGGGNKRITRPPNGDDVLPPKRPRSIRTLWWRCRRVFLLQSRSSVKFRTKNKIK